MNKLVEQFNAQRIQFVPANYIVYCFPTLFFLFLKRWNPDFVQSQTMAALKTTPNDKSVEEFLDSIEIEQKRKDCFEILEMMAQITQASPKMWGESIVGFGNYHYKYESGREGDWFLTGFSPRKQNLTLYIMSGFQQYDTLMQQLGKYKTGSSCLYIKRLSDIDKTILKQLIEESVQYLADRYG